MDASTQQAGFDKSKRLLNSVQYRHVLRRGKRIFNRLFLLIILPNNLAQPRLGITVSKKVSKKAVQRNRIKRQVREFYRQRQHSWPAYDYLVIAQPLAGKSDNLTVTQSLEKIWIKAEHQISY